MRNYSMKMVIPFLVVFVLVSVLAPGARAAMVGTEFMIASQEQGLKTELQQALVSEDVRQGLVSMGVDPRQVDARIAALSVDELQLLLGHLEDLPAGSGVIEVIGIVFLVLLILELVGVTNIFTKL